MLLLAVCAAFLFWLLCWALVRTAIGAAILFAWSSEQGFLGVAAYFAAWVFLLPFMGLGCLIIGWLDQRFHRQEERFQTNGTR